MTETTYLCRNCGERFAGQPADSRCPKCGELLNRWINSPTIELDPAQAAARPQAPSPGEPAEQLVGQELGQYRIDAFLGQGGMARVYLAMHQMLRRPCAIKVLRPATLQRERQAIDSFLTEARATAALSHPHAVTLHTIGCDQTRHFLEMEYVNGCCLSQLLEQSGKLDPLEATRFMLHISSALAAAHDLEMIHRDIKPANVMVTQRGAAKLADFGLAKQLTTQGASPRVLCGTPHYMAPELFAGSAANKQTDIYAMGVTYFSLLTGHLPVETKSINELIKYHTSVARINFEPMANDLPAEVTAILKTSLDHNPQARFADASELHDALREAFGNLRSLEALVGEAINGLDVEARGQDDEFVLHVSLPGGRGQTVHVEVTCDAEAQEPIIRVFSICCASTEAYFERALHLNSTVSHGAIAIEPIDGVPHFVMVNSYPRGTCDPEEIRKSIFDIARHSDAIEQTLTGEDRY